MGKDYLQCGGKVGEQAGNTFIILPAKPSQCLLQVNVCCRSTSSAFVAVGLGSRLAPFTVVVHGLMSALQVNIIRTVEVELENKLRDLRDLAKEETVKLRKWKGCHGDAVKKLQDIHQQSEWDSLHRTLEGCAGATPA